ncbi:MAG: ATP phosphoribosyltransferase regulatory subunit [Candidatus Gracilibacteria bacterium]|nr:ATP phosphoribosyltransferase regulatory subunit [Candidatus Gracilibacteria bacterium]
MLEKSEVKKIKEEENTEEDSTQELERKSDYFIKQRILFPDSNRYFAFLKKVFKHEFRKSGFKRITVSQVIKTDLLKDSSEKNIIEINPEYSLKTNSTIGILNSYIEHHKEEELQPIYYYYVDNILVQKKDYLKEHFVIGGEIIGEEDPILDMECIFIVNNILNSIGLKDTFTIRVNSLGLEKEQVKYFDALRDFYEDKKHLLTEKTIKNLEENNFEVLNAESEDEEILLEQAPKMKRFLKKHSKLHLAKFEEYMEMIGLKYEWDDTFIGDKAYCTNTVWEIVEKDTNIVLATGGRYDTLSMKLNPELKKEIPATGFSVKVARLIKALRKQNIILQNKDKLDLYIVQLGDEAKKQVFPIVQQARKAGINVLASLGTPSIKEQMLKAQRSGAGHVVIVGIMEARNGRWQVRNLEKGTQEEVKKEDIIPYIIDKIGKKNLNFYTPMDDLISQIVK